MLICRLESFYLLLCFYPPLFCGIFNNNGLVTSLSDKPKSSSCLDSHDSHEELA